jgi:uncharacterized membrane protein YvlD (DUF360 family)
LLQLGMFIFIFAAIAFWLHSFMLDSRSSLTTHTCKD